MITNSVNFFETNNSTIYNSQVKLTIVAWELKNPENLGQIIRLSHNVGANKVIFVNNKPVFRESKIKKTAGFSFHQMTWEIIREQDFFDLLAVEYQLVALETCDGAKNIFTTSLPDKMILVAGNESHGLPPVVIEKCKQKIFIPMPGGCKSMNVSHALSVASFEWYRQKTKKLF